MFRARNFIQREFWGTNCSGGLWNYLYSHGFEFFPPRERKILITQNFERFLCFVDRASWYNLRQWATWYTLDLFYNTFIIILYVFRALYAHHQEVELYWCSIWYRYSQQVAFRCTGWEKTAVLSDDSNGYRDVGLMWLCDLVLLLQFGRPGFNLWCREGNSFPLLFLDHPSSPSNTKYWQVFSSRIHIKVSWTRSWPLSSNHYQGEWDMACHFT